MSNSVNTTGKNIRALRQKREWSQSEAAMQLNISIPAFSKIETGITDINMSRLKQIAELFEVTVFDLIYEYGKGPATADVIEIENLKIRLTQKDEEVIKLQKKVIDLYEEVRISFTSDLKS